MRRARDLACGVAGLAALAAQAQAQAQPPAPPQAVPDGPFKTVHLMGLTPIQEAGVLAAVKDFNREFAAQGCASCAYHVFKMFSGEDTKYRYLMTSDWPSPQVYVRIHASPGFQAAGARNPILSQVSATEFYGRYVEVK